MKTLILENATEKDVKLLTEISERLGMNVRILEETSDNHLDKTNEVVNWKIDPRTGKKNSRTMYASIMNKGMGEILDMKAVLK